MPPAPALCVYTAVTGVLLLGDPLLAWGEDFPVSAVQRSALLVLVLILEKDSKDLCACEGGVELFSGREERLGGSGMSGR